MSVILYLPLGPTNIVPQQISFLFQKERSMKSDTLESASRPLAEVIWKKKQDEIQILTRIFKPVTRIRHQREQPHQRRSKCHSRVSGDGTRAFASSLALDSSHDASPEESLLEMFSENSEKHLDKVFHSRPRSRVDNVSPMSVGIDRQLLVTLHLAHLLL